DVALEVNGKLALGAENLEGGPCLERADRGGHGARALADRGYDTGGIDLNHAGRVAEELGFPGAVYRPAVEEFRDQQLLAAEGALQCGLARSDCKPALSTRGGPGEVEAENNQKVSP